MKSQLDWNTTQNLEFTSTQTIQKNHSLSTQLKDLWQSVLNYFNTSSEPLIWQPKGSAGMVWSAYDPVTKQSIEQASLEELRIWLEDRHYQNV